MERDTKICSIRNPVGDELLLLFIAAAIRPLLVMAGIGYRQGILFLAEDETVQDWVIRVLDMLGAVERRSIRSKVAGNILNSQIAFHVFMQYDAPEDLDRFLNDDSFAPVVLSYGVIPRYLKDMKHVIFLDRESCSRCIVEEAIKAKEAFCRFAYTNPDAVQNSIRRGMTSNAFLQAEDLPLVRTLRVTQHVFCDFYRNTHTEAETEQVAKRLQESLACLAERMSANIGEWDVAPAVVKALKEYVAKNDDVVIGPADEIGGELAKALQNDTALLYDGDFYFVSDRLLRKACNSLLVVVSLPVIKEALTSSGILECNNVHDRNFTVKKVLVTVYGEIFRKRFLKLRKRGFADISEFELEEKKEETGCTSESLIEYHV